MRSWKRFWKKNEKKNRSHKHEKTLRFFRRVIFMLFWFSFLQQVFCLQLSWQGIF